jgi:hypothetical protein
MRGNIDVTGLSIAACIYSVQLQFSSHKTPFQHLVSSGPPALLSKWKLSI